MTTIRTDGEIDWPENTAALPMSFRYLVHRAPDNPWRNTYEQALAEHRVIRAIRAGHEPDPTACPRCWGPQHQYGHTPPLWENHGGGIDGPDGPPIGQHAYILRLRAEITADETGLWNIEDHYTVPPPTPADIVARLIHRHAHEWKFTDRRKVMEAVRSAMPDWLPTRPDEPTP